MRVTVKQEWETFAKLLPKNAGPAQREDMRVAYYAGATSLFHMIVQGVTPGDEVEPEDLDMMDSIQNELDTFHDEMKVKLALMMRQENRS